MEVTRRHVVRTSMLNFLRCCALLPTLAERAVRAAAPRLNWQAFLDQIDLAATEQHRQDWNQPWYVQRVAGVARALNLDDKRFALTRNGAGRHHQSLYPEFRELQRTADVQISLINFERG